MAGSRIAQDIATTILILRAGNIGREWHKHFSYWPRQRREALGYPAFWPDACLINRYEPGAQLTLHQDKNERDFSQPIISVSLGLPATFLFGGLKRSDKVQRLSVHHG